MQAGGNDFPWQLRVSPIIVFYRALHAYLKKQPRISKTLIRKFYTANYCNLKEKGSRPDNVYRFIDNIVSSQRLSDDPLAYDTKDMRGTSPIFKKRMRKGLARMFEILELCNTAHLALHNTSDTHIAK